MKILIILTSFLLLIAISVSLIYLGYLPLPKFIVTTLAKQKNLSDKETQDIYKIVDIYQILKKSNSKEVKELQKIIINGASQEEIIQFSINNYDKISDETKEKIINKLNVDSNDYIIIKDILDNKQFFMNQNKLDTLYQLKDKYGISDSLIMKIIN